MALAPSPMKPIVMTIAMMDAAKSSPNLIPAIVALNLLNLWSKNHYG
jgi:hypothetical protein